MMWSYSKNAKVNCNSYSGRNKPVWTCFGMRFAVACLILAR